MALTDLADGWQLGFMDGDELEWRAINRLYQPLTQFKLEVRPPQGAMRIPDVIKGEGFLNRVRLDIAVASNLWNGLPRGKINLLEHLAKLLPQEAPLHLVTYQNGIQNTVDDFQKMGTSIVEKVASSFGIAPLFLGFYNPMLDLICDVDRVADHLANRPTETVLRTCIIFKELIKKLTALRPNLRWLHIAHSEGGGIAKRALMGLEESEKALMRKHLITATYGPLIPIPKNLALLTLNTYSKGDNTTLRYAKTYMEKGGDDYDDKDISIRFVNSLAPPENRLPPGDHAFAGATYQGELKKNMDEIVEYLKRSRT